MVTFPPVDAPTAAILGGLAGGAAGFAADNLTAVIQRRLRRKSEQTQKKIVWYEETVQIVNEIRIVAISHKTHQDVKEDSCENTLPTNEDINDAVDQMTEEDYYRGVLDLDGVEITFSKSGGNIDQMDDPQIPRDAVIDGVRDGVEEFKINQQQEVEDEISNDMKELQLRLTRHYASAPMDLNEELSESLRNLLGDCFGVAVGGWISDDIFEGINEQSEQAKSICEEHIQRLSV